MKIRTLAYGRMSSDDQDGSIEQQRQWFADVQARDNLDVLKVFTDPGISGSDFDQRKEVQAMIAFAEQLFRQGKPAQRILTWKADRLSRSDSCDTHALIIRPLRQSGILNVQTHDGHLIDLFSRRDLLLFNIEQDAYAAEYLTSLASNIMRGKADVARSGYWNGGPAPLGYRIIRTGETLGRRKLSRLVLGPLEEQELIRWMFRTYHESETSCTQLARELNRKGVKPSRAESWSQNCVNSIISNRTYVGENRWNERHVGKFAQFVDGAVKASSERGREETKRRKGLKCLPTAWNAEQDAIIVRDAHPPLIDEALFNAVQAKLASQAARTAIREDRFHELADLVKCGHCGANCWMIPNPRKGLKTTVRVECSRHRREGKAACSQSGGAHHTEILRRVVEILQRDLGSEDAQARILAAVKARAVEVTQRQETSVESIQSEIDALEVKRLKEARRLLELPKSVLESATAAHEETIAALGLARARLAEVNDLQPANRADVDLAQRAMMMLTCLPKVVERVDELQTSIETEKDRTKKEGRSSELLVAKRLIRDTLFSLIATVRVFYSPVSPRERKGKGSGHRYYDLADVQLTLHPHIQDVLLQCITDGNSDCSWFPQVLHPTSIILSYLHPYAA